MQILCLTQKTSNLVLGNFNIVESVVRDVSCLGPVVFLCYIISLYDVVEQHSSLIKEFDN